ncbi:MAG: ABC transporter permease [Candidatus Methanoperedens sp.]|nr:ABC transporter permease [Candidatus Methanoperedens sp.]
MFYRLVSSAIQRRKLRIALAVLAVVMGASIASTLLTVSFDINDKIGRELKSYGANILLQPSSEGAFINESELYKIKTIFWRHNIIGYSPYLSDTVKVNDTEIVLSGTYLDEEIRIPGLNKTFIGNRIAKEKEASIRTGVKTIAPWWKVDGEWPAPKEALVGISAAEKLGLKRGDIFRAEFGSNNEPFKVSGILSTGGDEDGQVIVSLKDAQMLFGKQGMVDRVVVSALTTPEPEDKIEPSMLPPEEYEIWYCTPYISSIMLQIEEAVPGASAKPIRQVADNEGKLLKKFEMLMLLITGIAMTSASLGVSTAMTTSIFERRKEIGLMKSIGADGAQISGLFFAEALVIGIIGGAIGILIGAVLAGTVGLWVFGSTISASLPAVLLSWILSIGVALLGSMLPVKKAAEIEPSIILRGD